MNLYRFVLRNIALILIIFFHLAISFGSFFDLASAQSVFMEDGPTYPTVVDETVNLNDPQMEDLTLLALSIIRFLTGFSGGIIILMIVYGGFQYINGYMEGDEEAYNSAKSTFFHAILGLILILTSYLIVTMFQSALTSTSFN